MTTVVLADDHPMVRQGIRAVLEGADDLELIAEAEDGAAAVRLCAELRPDVVLMDLQMPGVHGIDATREIRTIAPATAVLVLTMYDDDETVFAAVSAGASGYLLKGADGGDIVAALRAAAAGQAVFGVTLALRLKEWFQRPTSKDPTLPFPELSEREREILDGVAAGLTNAEIGARLFLSPKTVANNITAVLSKLHLSNRIEAILKGREAGLGIDPRQP